MDPVVDTGFDEGVNEDQINPVQPKTLENDLFPPVNPDDSAAQAPELYPHGATGQLEGAAPVPGSTDIEQLPVPPPKFMMHQQEQQQQEEQQEKGDDQEEEEVEGDDLFGDGDDDDEDDLMKDGTDLKLPTPPPFTKPAQSEEEEDDGLTPEERAHRKLMEYDEEERLDSGAESGDGLQRVTETHQEIIAQVPLVNYSVPAGGKVWHAKLPNFLRLETPAWNRDQWKPENEEQDVPPEETASQEASQSQSQSQGGEEVKPKVGRSKSHLPDENVIRWRWTKDELGQFVKQSNARIVRWSDGSLSLQVGSELFDISLALDHSANISRAQNPVAPSTNPIGLTPTTFDANRGHGLTYLTARHEYNKLFESQASVEGTMTFRPSTLTSQTHKRLAGSVAARYGQKGRGIKTFMAEADPELQKIEREKLEVEKQRKAKKEAQKAAGKGSRSGGRKGKKATTLEGLDFSEDEDEGEGVGYADRRSQPKRGRAKDAYSEEDDDGFLANSDDDMQVSDQGEGELDAADEALERRRKDRSSRKQREYSASTDENEGEEAAASQGVRRRMVVESDEE
ncbi:RNA polymerase-associated LEO1 family protein [Sporobolomyces salmoneus]|uniref:RNA polymerase-associated LEO1 family protein n=1 Tax=Sporobolomyces salmoneus TaxID=183962 RepID=UPI0031785734